MSHDLIPTVWKWILAIPALLGVLALLVIGANVALDWFSSDRDQVNFTVYNGMDQDLDVFYVVDGEETRIIDNLPPERSSLVFTVLRDGSDCTKGDLVARTSGSITSRPPLSNIEVARRTEPLCLHQLWTIELPRSPAPP